MKIKTLIAVLFCASLLSCNTTPIPSYPTFQTGIGIPTVTFSNNTLTISDTVTVKANVDSIVDALITGATITTNNFSLRLISEGPDKLKIFTQLSVPLSQQTSESRFEIIPSATAAPAPQNISVSIIGNNSCHSPYTGNEPILIHVENAIPGASYVIGFPTNHIPRSHGPDDITYGAANYINADQNGVINYLFNAPTSTYLYGNTMAALAAAHPTWYLLPSANPHSYYFTVRVWYGNHESKAYFNIIP